MAGIVTALLDALAKIAIPVVQTLLNEALQAIVGWWMDRQEKETLSKIIDAASLAAKAETPDERFKAAQAWRAALSSGRVAR